MKILVLFTFLCFTVVLQTAAQDKPELTPEEPTVHKAYLKAGIDYLTNNVYLGRADTASAQVFSPSLTYTFKNGLYVTGSAEYIPSRTVNKLDGGNVGLGYNFSLSDHLEGSISWTKLFYASTSTQISSSISSTTNASLDYNLDDIFTTSLSLDFNKGVKGSKNDFLFNPTLTHDFILAHAGGESNFIIITPTAGLNAGTQNFYDSYLIKKKGLKARAVNARITKYEGTLSKFSMLDYEFSLPVNYSIKPFLFSATPTLALPQNKLAKIITAGQVKSPSLFYVDFSVVVKF